MPYQSDRPTAPPSPTEREALAWYEATVRAVGHNQASLRVLANLFEDLNDDSR